MASNQQALRELPSVETLAKSLSQGSALPRAMITAFVQREISRFRNAILAGQTPTRSEIEKNIGQQLDTFSASRLQPVINATGVVIHTNLGRSPLGASTAEALTKIATGYCNL
ncbi:MAG: L-seryl-tRNA(Sec) selenium transferase, partial [Akkermansiaceae bacterium]